MGHPLLQGTRRKTERETCPLPPFNKKKRGRVVEGRKKVGPRSDQPPAPVWISPFFTARTRPSETRSPRRQTDAAENLASHHTVAAINPTPSGQSRSSCGHNMERSLWELPRPPKFPDLLVKRTIYRSITKSLELFSCKNPKEETVLVDSNCCSGFKLLPRFYLALLRYSNPLHTERGELERATSLHTSPFAPPCCLFSV